MLSSLLLVYMLGFRIGSEAAAKALLGEASKMQYSVMLANYLAYREILVLLNKGDVVVAAKEVAANKEMLGESLLDNCMSGAVCDVPLKNKIRKEAFDLFDDERPIQKSAIK